MPTTRIPYGVLDGRYINAAGDTMLGNLTLAGAPTLDLHAATKKYIDDAVGVGGHTHTLDAGATDVTATATEVNLLDLSGLSIGQVLRATGDSSASWGSIQSGDLPAGIDAAKLADGSVSNVEYQYLNGVTSAIQTQLDAKAADSVVLRKDGSVALTADWDIGDIRKILADGIRARDDAGLELYDDGGNGIFIEDGGEVGIGTIGPDRKLDVLDASNPQLRLTHTDGAKFADFQVDTNHDLTIKPSSTGQIILQPTTDSTDFFQVLDADGGTSILNVDATNERIGIGTSTPLEKLHIAANWADVVMLGTVVNNSDKFGFMVGTQYASDTETEGVALLGMYNDNTDNRVMFGGGHTGRNAATSIRFYTAANVTTRTGTERLRVTGAGNVGIGTTGPDRLLDVLDASNPQLRLTHTDGNVYTDFQTVSEGYLYINPSGNRVGIRTSSPSQALEVAGSVVIGAHDTYHKLYVNRYSSTGYAYIVAGDTDRDMGVGLVFQYRSVTGALNNGLLIGIDGKIGIGTEASRKLDIFDPSASQLRLTQLASTNYVDFLTTTSGDLTITPSGSKVLVAKALEIDGAFDHDGSTFGVFGVTPASRVAAYTVTNAITDRSFDADNTTIAELADVVATIIGDLKTYGFFQ
jgi:hypothetical protein